MLTIWIVMVNNIRQLNKPANEEESQHIARPGQTMSNTRPLWNKSDSNISLGELRERLNDPDLKIVDVRPLPAYNGWRLSGTARGGHIPGAAAFPSTWLKSVDEPEVERLLKTKGILASPEIVLYGD